MKMINHKKSWDLIAHDYESEIVSPFSHARHFPLIKTLDKIKYLSNYHAVDFGTGTGPLLPLIYKKFKNITAIDFSSEMLSKAKTRVSSLPLRKNQNISFQKIDLTKSNYSLKCSFDIAFSINSIIEPDIIKTEKIFSNILSSLRGPRIFIGVFPAIESFYEEYHYSYLKFRKQKYSHEKASQLTDISLETKRLNSKLGTYRADGLTQKYFRQNEISLKLQKFGLKNITFDKVIYKRQFSFNLKEQSLRNHPYMWDWFVLASQ